MAKIQINNPRQIINGGAKKYYFKVKGLGGPKGDKGDKGDTGATGPQGPQGNAATVSVGSTTTLPVGYDATVTNSGSIYNAVLDFGIPQGPRGPQGAKGDKGDTGAQGETGPRGPQGERGTNATVYVGTTTTTNPGTQARVYNSGTDSNAVLNFEIPRGDVGPSVPLVQETGYSTTKAMSQNATTEALNDKQNTLTAGSNIQISGSTISATDTKYSAGNGITLTGTQFSANTSVLATKNDLGSYYTKTQIDSQMAAKQDDLVAGSNIQIAPDGKTISATDTTYTAGTGLTLTGTEFSADTTVLATKSDLDDYYTKTETDTKLAPKLEAEVVAELPTTGAEGKLYLTPKAQTTQTATGNPIEATITSQAGQIESFQLDGDTFQQTYTGKNLFDGITTNQVISSDGTIADNNNWDLSGFIKVEPNTAYTVSFKLGSGGSHSILVPQFDGDKGFLARWGSQTTAPYTFTTGSTTGFIRLNYNNTNNDTNFQVEAGSATSFEPYVGGVPSPNPEYPQQIQTVTGLQTISINGTDYPLDLGSIELCKLGTYQDYIYEDGDDWKVHKAITTITVDGSEDWSYNGDNKFSAADISGMAMPINAGALCYCATHIGVLSAQNGAEFTPLVADKPYATDVHKTLKTVRFKDIRFTTTTELQSWLSQNNTTIYYVVATPTDIAITDQTLIAQLEAIRTASLQNGTNTITNTATGSNLAGDMEIGYYGYNPTNRYDKFIWLDLNNNYEQIGS